MTDFATLQLKVDSSELKPAVDKLDTLTSAGKRAEDATEKLGRTSRVAAQHIQAVGTSAGAQRAGMQQLSFQIGDVASSFASGISPMVIFAQQGGQVVQSISLMRGSAGGLIGFLSGPWGAAFMGAVTVAGLLASKMGAGEKASNDLSSAIDFQRMSTGELIDAINELNEAQGKQTKTAYANEAQAYRNAAASLAAAAADRQLAIAKLQVARAEQMRTTGGDGGTGARGGLGALVGVYDAEITKLNAAILKGDELIRKTQIPLARREAAAATDAAAAATLKYDKAEAALTARFEKGALGAKEYQAQLNRLTETREAELKAAREKDKKPKKSEEEKEFERQLKTAERYLEQLEIERDELGKSAIEVKMLAAERAAAAAPTVALRNAILASAQALSEETLVFEARSAAAKAFAEIDEKNRRAFQQRQEDAASYMENTIAPLEKQVAVLGLTGSALAKARVEYEKFHIVLNYGVEAWLRYQDAQTAIIRDMEKTEAVDRFTDSILDLIDALNQLGGVGGAIGGAIGLFSGQLGTIDGPIGALLRMETGGKKVVDGKEVALTFGDELRDIFGEKFGEKMLDVFRGAGTGVIAGATVFGKQSSTEQLGSAIGGALGKVAGDALGKTMSGALGAAMGPIGSIVGGIAGSLLGGLMTKTKWGRVNLTAAGASDAVGNDSSSRRAAVKAGGGFMSALEDIADAFGGDIGDFGSIALGVRHGDWRVNTGGTSLKKKKGAVDFDDDAEAAISFALQEAIERGAITGIRESTQRLLKSSDDLQKNLEKALSFEGVFTELKSIKDPLGSALDNLTKEFDRLRGIFDEAGASASEYAQLEELLAMKRAEAIADEGRRAVDKLSERNSLEVQLLELMGRSEDALAAARLNELASLEASLQPLQAMVYQLQDARAIIDQFGPLADDLRAFKQELLGNSSSAGGFAIAQARFRETSALAKNGDAGALGNLRTTATEFLDAAKANASSALDYQRAVGEVLASVDQGIFAADSQVEYAQLQIDAVNNTANIIASMKEEMRVYQQQIVENTSYMARLWSRFEGDGLLIKTDTDTPLQVEVV